MTLFYTLFYLFKSLFKRSFKISLIGRIEKESAKQIINCKGFKMVSPNTKPAGVKIRKSITNKVTPTDVFINLLLNGLLLKIEPSYLLLKQWNICEIPSVAKAIVIAVAVSPKSLPTEYAIKAATAINI